jgi:uracil-DNA glycosylase
MPHDFDPGYGNIAYRTLCQNYPDKDVYPPADFRTEWGPIFHRGRLDGTARLLVIGQDPAQQETIARRILVGEAGQRVQGFLFKLGIERSYVLINTFLYSVYGQGGGNRHKNNQKIAAYRNGWLDALFADNPIQGVVALGGLAEDAWNKWKATPKGSQFNPVFARITHPTQPESSSKGDKTKRAAATKAMLQNWNAALSTLKPALTNPDTARPLVLYGDAFRPDEIIEIPEADLPPGVPPWMRGVKSWARRTGLTVAIKRCTITVTIPTAFRP